jgi:hypothetical protein
VCFIRRLNPPLAGCRPGHVVRRDGWLRERAT